MGLEGIYEGVIGGERILYIAEGRLERSLSLKDPLVEEGLARYREVSQKESLFDVLTDLHYLRFEELDGFFRAYGRVKSAPREPGRLVELLREFPNELTEGELFWSLNDIEYADLQSDLSRNEDLKKFLRSSPEILQEWIELRKFPELRVNIKALKEFSRVPRIGEYGKHVSLELISNLTRAHGAPKRGQESDIVKHETIFTSQGYDLSQAIPVVELPDGTLLMADGHHRLKALENLNQIVVPVDRLSIYEAKQLYGTHGFATLV
jgi:hypothetical protein